MRELQINAMLPDTYEVRDRKGGTLLGVVNERGPGNWGAMRSPGGRQTITEHETLGAALKELS